MTAEGAVVWETLYLTGVVPQAAKIFDMHQMDLALWPHAKFSREQPSSDYFLAPTSFPKDRNWTSSVLLERLNG